MSRTRCFMAVVVGCALAVLLVRDSAATNTGSLMEAEQLVQQGDWAAAERQCRAVIREQPDNARAYKLLGMVYVAQQQFQSADEPLRRACQLDLQDEAPCYYLGRNYYALSRYADSRAVLTNTLKRFPGSARIKVGLGLTLEALGETEQAAKYLRDAAKTGNPDALSEYGQFLFRQGQVAESIDVLKRAGNREALDRASKQLNPEPATPAQLGPVVPPRFSRFELPMVVKNGATGEKHQVETMIAGVAV